MSEEKKEKDKQIFPEPTVGALIYNDDKEILLVKNPEWSGLWNIPGGRVELGETCEQALKREIMDKTGLEIDKIEFIGWQEAINPQDFTKKRHFIFLNFCAQTVGGEIKKSDEMEEFIWLEPGEALKSLKIDAFTINTINYYFKHLEKAEKSEDNYLELYKRALADYHNLLKQTAREKEEFAKYANEQLLRDILPVYDNLKTSLKHADESAVKNGWLDGIKYVIKQFKETLNNYGIEEITAENGKFNHNLMDAVESEITDIEENDGLVARELAGGYSLNGKVIRPARVVVYKKSS